MIQWLLEKKLTGYSEYSGEERKVGFLLRTKANPRKWDNKWGKSTISICILPKKLRWGGDSQNAKKAPKPFIKGSSQVQECKRISIRLTVEVWYFYLDTVCSFLALTLMIIINFPSQIKRVKWADSPARVKEGARVTGFVRLFHWWNKLHTADLVSLHLVPRKDVNISPFLGPERKTQVMPCV